MKHQQLYILLVLLLPFAIQSHGQVKLNNENRHFLDQVSEKLVVFTDRDLYLAGEDIWFSCFAALNGDTQDQLPGRVLYVELIDKTMRTLQKGKFTINSNHAAGKLQIPPETLSEVYFLRAYTQYQRNNTPESFCTLPLTIINPEFTLPGNGESKAEPVAEPEATAQIGIKTQKSIYTRREEVQLNLEWTGAQKAACCVSVVRHGTLENQLLLPESKPPVRMISDSLFWIPDIRMVSLSGFVREKNTGNPAADVGMYLSVMGENPILHITRSQSNGAFVFALNSLTGTREVFVGLKQTSGPELDLLINNDFPNQPVQLPDVPLAIDSTYQNILTDMYINHQTQLAFDRMQELFEPEPEFEHTLFGKYDFTVRPDDYIDLGSLEEIFYEIVPPVSVRTTNGKKQLFVANYETDRVLPNDLLLLDNVPVFDVEELLRIPPANIDQIDVINRPYYLGDFLLQNVILITTKSSDFGGYNFPGGSIFLEYLSLSPQAVYKPVMYDNPGSVQSSTADFRTLLFWNPSINLEQADNSMRFFTSDNTGQYDIFVRGVTSGGKPFYNKTSIWIK